MAVEISRKYQEDFLQARGVKVDSSLPFKLQKRRLLEKLGFPIDDNVIVSADNQSELEKVFTEFTSRGPFLIGVHLKPMRTFVTPFFLVSEEGITYRNENDIDEEVSREKVFGIIRKFSSRDAWIEFVELIWSSTTIAGRLIYFSSRQQLLELQEGVSPKELGNNRERFPYFTQQLQDFRMSTGSNGFDQFSVNSVCLRRKASSIISVLQSHRYSFRALRRIAKMPTVEFGYLRNRRLVVIDVDWPDQYKKD